MQAEPRPTSEQAPLEQFFNSGTLSLNQVGLCIEMLYVDQHGSVGYTTGNVGAPPHTERDPFNIDPTTGYVTFNDCSAEACPTGAEKDHYTLWFTNDNNASQQKDCVDSIVQAYYTPYRPSCTYN
ncbi:hypothetical protein TI39_contig5927g00005 [Zymoseptoria brevis]|uniref:Uncharacterized protein n=1 Tax=Zymoseptoria brevis TaxID=1047168 RepID=A0A0F4G4W2_9PEZI|nr:hypothetical protein TI39_contig5927g00005 [Zymoseptoria brevis]